MAPKELTKQAFKLYDTLKVQGYQTSECSDYSKRLHSLGLRAFCRYKRRLEFEQRQDDLSAVSRWGF